MTIQKLKPVQVAVRAAFAGWALLVAVGTVSCGKKKSDGSLPTLDIAAAIDNPREFDLSEIAENIDFIPLDNSDKRGLIGAYIGDLQESRHGFYICEGFMTPVQHFDRTGKLVSTIGRIGRGPDETSYITDMAVDYYEGNVYINGLNRTVVAYDKTGRMFARNDSISSNQLIYNDGLLFSLQESPDASYDKERFYFVKMYSGNLQPQGVIDAPNLGPSNYFFTDGRSGAYGYGSLSIMSDNGERLVVRQARNDTVYYYNAGTLRPAMLMNTGRYTFPDDGYGRDPLVAMSEKFYVVTNLWESERWIVVTASNFQRMPSGERLVFDREDLFTGFSATNVHGTSGLYLDGVAFTPMYIRDNRLVGYIRTLDIIDNADGITDPKLKEIAATLKEDGNPVIVVAELKK